MKPFDLEAAKRGKPVCTRNGRPAYFMGVAPAGIDTDKPIVAWVHGSSAPDNFFPCGRYGRQGEFKDYDLFMAPRKRTMYLNVWHDDDGNRHHNLYDSTTAAREAALFFSTTRGCAVRVTAQPIEWEE